MNMSLKPSTKNFKSCLSAVLGLLVVLSFQNCSDLDNTNVITLTDIETNVLSNLPFAYDLKIDQMAYMSCSGPFASGDVRSFTLKAGGYFPGAGVALKPNYTAALTDFNADAKVRSLQISDRNDQAGVVMSIRPRNDLQNYVDPDGQTGEIPVAKMMFNESQGLLLSNERVARQLFALGPGSYLNYAAGLPGLFQKSFDGVVRIANDAGTEDFVRNLLRNSHYLAFNFSEPAGIQPPDRPNLFVKSPFDTLTGATQTRTSVFGLGYTLNFQQLDPLMTTTPPRVMSIGSVVNLENSGFEAESWNCGERFIVVRPEDASRLSFNPTPMSPGGTGQVCDTRSDSIPTTIAEQQRWERIRNSLPVEDWYVNLPCPGPEYMGPPIIGCIPGVPKPGCIVPKGNDFCYDFSNPSVSGNPNIKVAYYRNENLSSADPVIDYNGSCGPGTLFICPHAVSICYKQQQ
jgi:hypothetical protein